MFSKNIRRSFFAAVAGLMAVTGFARITPQSRPVASITENVSSDAQLHTKENMPLSAHININDTLLDKIKTGDPQLTQRVKDAAMKSLGKHISDYNFSDIAPGNKAFDALKNQIVLDIILDLTNSGFFSKKDEAVLKNIIPDAIFLDLGKVSYPPGLEQQLQSSATPTISTNKLRLF